MFPNGNIYGKVKVLVTQLCLTLWAPVHGILQARILEWVATSFSRGSSWPRDQTQASCTGGGFFITEPPRKDKETINPWKNGKMAGIWTWSSKWWRSNWEDKGKFNKVYLYRFLNSKIPNSRSKLIQGREPSHERFMTCFREEEQGGKVRMNFLILLFSQTLPAPDFQYAHTP